MKKQISEKSSKKTLAKKLNAAVAKNLESGQEKDKDKIDPEDEMTDEEKLEEAKKASRNKASQQDQTEMLKKLFLENVAKYALLATGLALLSIAVIKYGPELVGLLNGLVFKSIIGAISR
ncbi:MAG: hypothetical protein KA100_01600 [Rickettsiales bacterium]|nr:hypothetical protein [Rickettsiales bacterium]